MPDARTAAGSDGRACIRARRQDTKLAYEPGAALMDLFTSNQPAFWPALEEWVSRSELVLVKKLSRNDQSWAEDPRKHQAGFFIPRDIRDARFFPTLGSFVRSSAFAVLRMTRPSSVTPELFACGADSALFLGFES